MCAGGMPIDGPSGADVDANGGGSVDGAPECGPGCIDVAVDIAAPPLQYANTTFTDGIENTFTVGPTGMLRKVREVAPGNVWAAGTYYDAGTQRYQTLVEHFDGTAWIPEVSANGPTGDDEILVRR